MSQLKLYGMKAAYDEILATAVKRQHEPPKIVGDPLAAEISESEPANAIGSRAFWRPSESRGIPKGRRFVIQTACWEGGQHAWLNTFPQTFASG